MSQQQNQPVIIEPTGDYALKGATILAIVQGLKHTIPIEYISSVNSVEGLLASAARIQIQQEAPQPTSSLQVVQGGVQ
jgi:hypothetical protein